MLLTAFWAYKGLEVEIWYRLLARTVGEGHGAATILTKALLDQFVYCPLFAVPLTVLVYKWNSEAFSVRAVLDDFRSPGWYNRSVLPTLLANLGVWLPAVAIIYALPRRCSFRCRTSCSFSLRCCSPHQRPAVVSSA